MKSLVQLLVFRSFSRLVVVLARFGCGGGFRYTGAPQRALLRAITSNYAAHCSSPHSDGILRSDPRDWPLCWRQTGLAGTATQSAGCDGGAVVGADGSVRPLAIRTNSKSPARFRTKRLLSCYSSANPTSPIIRVSDIKALTTKWLISWMDGAIAPPLHCLALTAREGKPGPCTATNWFSPDFTAPSF